MTEIEITVRRDHQFAAKPGTRTVCRDCGMSRFHPAHGAVSLNQFGKNKSSYVYNQAKQLWQLELRRLLTEAEMPVCERVQVMGLMCFPDQRDRDQGNYRYFIEKALGDALQAGGWLANDKWDYFEFGQLDKTYQKGQQWTTLRLYPEPHVGGLFVLGAAA